MIKNLFVLFFFSAQFFFSQKYHFDYFVEDSSKLIGSSEEPWKRTFFYDSQSKLKLILRNDGKGLYGTIYDEKGRRSHFFDVNYKNNKLIFSYGFTDEYGTGNSFEDVNKNDVFEVVKKDSLLYMINIFSNNKKKKIKYAIEVFLEPAEAEFLELPMEYSRFEEVIELLKTELPSDKKFVIKKAKSKNNQRSIKSESNLTKFEKVDLSLVLPEKLIIKDPFSNIQR